MTPQQKQVYNHLRDKKTISALEATALYRVSSLTKVISELIKQGFTITSEFRFDHTGKRYKRYFMGASN
jgi:hypothetical protein